MRRFLCIALIATSFFSAPAFAGLQQLKDAIDEIESKIDGIDLNQSKDDIRSELDEVKTALEDLEDDQPVYTDQKRFNPNAQKLSDYFGPNAH